ncbi:uncharacterized protein LOC111792597 [Cucurbita pepo subsp. pepo]|uniref:uncharacterized protein LOC111792597 n=1 Tax=Cucurbita pepo subsp. pepo TaxID=3664 RepID=UPI000C9DA548|nr:uncharacterized protein LOC111792597 [Cucurbita pepo subsp. pepo]
MEEIQAVKSTTDNPGEDFYEMIEAPKFVDFTVSDHFIPDDRYWFCSRVGCEEKHPEEMDSEVIYKNFVMRVMAARSPNVRLQRARRNLKCPLTAPPKSSKSRVARLALISSISNRIVDARVKSRPPIPKPTTTLNAKARQVHAKAMTTPRNKKLKSNSNGFLSVKNPKTTLAEMPKTTTVAKALIFQSPKKDAKKKNSIEMSTPVKTLCAAMKKLEITSAKKNRLGDGQPLPLDPSRRKFRGREVKSRVFDSLGTYSCKRRDAKSARVLKRRSKEKNLKPPLPDHMGQDIVDEDASDMDIDDKSRHVSMQGSALPSSAKNIEGNQDELPRSEDSDNLSKDSNETSISNSENNHEEIAKIDALELNISEYLASGDKENVAEIDEGIQDEKVLQIEEPLDENTDNGSKNFKDDETSISNSEASDFKLVLSQVEDEKNQESNHEERTKSGEIQINISEHEIDDKENAVSSDDDIVHESETITDENTAPKHNRVNNSSDQSERVPFGKLEKSKNTAKVNGVLKKKTLKENTTPAALGAHGLKPSKPKSTNPKPFRLRTDERVVLREANLGKKLNCPLKDITASRRFHGDKLQRKTQSTVHQNSGCDDHVEYEQGVLQRKTPDDQQGRTVPDSSNNNKKADSQNCVALKQHQKQSLCRQLKPAKERSTKPDENLKRSKLEKMQTNVRKPPRVGKWLL